MHVYNDLDFKTTEGKAFLIGNGINRYAGVGNSWEDILQELCNDCGIQLPKHVSLPEFYNIIELETYKRHNESQGIADYIPLKSINESISNEIRGKLISKLREIVTHPLHKEFIRYANDNRIPVITTNFDIALKDELIKFDLSCAQSSKVMTWNRYYAYKEIDDPLCGFGLWYIHGNLEQKDSIKLSLTDYILCCERARKMIHDSDRPLFKGKDQEHWKGENTLLHIIFNKDLIIMGLGLDVQEVFIRWLLIERAKYFQVFHDRSKKAWYLCKRCEVDQSKKLFMAACGVIIIEYDTYEDIYMQYRAES